MTYAIGDNQWFGYEDIDSVTRKVRRIYNINDMLETILNIIYMIVVYE